MKDYREHWCIVYSKNSNVKRVNVVSFHVEYSYFTRLMAIVLKALAALVNLVFWNFGAYTRNTDSSDGLWLMQGIMGQEGTSEVRQLWL